MLCDFIYIFMKPKQLNGLILLVWWSQHSLHLLSRLASPLISWFNVVSVHFSACSPIVNQALNRLLRGNLSNSTQGSLTSVLTQPQENWHSQLLPKSCGRREKSLEVIVLFSCFTNCRTMCLLLRPRNGPHLSHVSSGLRHILVGAAISFSLAQEADWLQGSAEIY